MGKGDSSESSPAHQPHIGSGKQEETLPQIRSKGRTNVRNVLLQLCMCHDTFAPEVIHRNIYNHIHVHTVYIHIMHTFLKV